MPVGVKLVGYSILYPSVEERAQTLDEHFKINEKGYTVTRKLKNALNLPHILTISLSSNTLPVSDKFKYSGKIRIQVSRNGRVVYDAVTTSKDTFNIGYRTIDTIGGFHLMDTPFPIGGGPYTDVELTIIVEELDNFLQGHVKDMQLDICSEMLNL